MKTSNIDIYIFDQESSAFIYVDGNLKKCFIDTSMSLNDAYDVFALFPPAFYSFNVSNFDIEGTEIDWDSRESYLFDDDVGIVHTIVNKENVKKGMFDTVDKIKSIKGFKLI